MLNRLVLSFALVALSCSAAAQEPRSTNPDPYNPDRAKISLSEDQARRYTDDFARCIASNQPKKAAAILALPYGAAEQGKAASELMGRELDCLGPMTGSFELSTDLRPIVAGMAEYFIANPGKLAAVRQRDPALFVYVAPVGVETFGECVVAQNPAAVEKLAKSPVASDAETAATDALTPELEQCVSKGQTLELDRTALRHLLAVSLYKHLAMTPAPQTAPTHR